MYSTSSVAITPEQVLGEYWKDPLFGEASSDKSVSIEILQGTLWPKTIIAQKDQTLRILFINKTEELHFIAISEDIESLVKDEEFKLFVKEEIYHAELNPITNGQHTHASTELDDAKSIVVTLDDRPTVLIPRHDKKEILIRLNKAVAINLQCILDGHDSEKGEMKIE